MADPETLLQLLPSRHANQRGRRDESEKLMNLSRHHVVALIGATLTSTIALSDAILHGVTGRNSIFSDNSGHPNWIIAGGLVHGFTYAALSWVLIREHRRFSHANRLARALRYVLLASLLLLAAGFVGVAPIVVTNDLPPTSAFGTAWVWVASIGFAGMILSSLVLGITVLRTNPLGYGGRLLGLLIVIVPITVALGFLAPKWAHPAYIETTIHFGVALLGVAVAAVGASRPRRQPATELVTDDRAVQR
jgi:hypothetical protein